MPPSVTSAEKLLKLARAAKLQRSPVTAPIEPVDRGGRLPLSFAQQRLWFLEQMGGLGDTYHIPTQLRLGRELDLPALRRALDAVLARHEALRTTFVEVQGEPVQRIAPPGTFPLVEHDLREHPRARAELRRLSAEEASALFDLEHGPLIRGRLVRLPGDDHLLLLTMHHIVSDGWSMEVLTRELGTLYAAFRRGEENPLPPLTIQYADYAAWQRKWVAGEVLRAQAEYWKRTLAGVPELLELPTDHPRPARKDHAGVALGIDLGEELTAGLNALSQRHGTTLFMTLLAGWAVVLGRLSGQHDVVVGTPSANRGRTEIEGLIGFFVNILALRMDLSGSPTVAELLEQVRARSLGAQQNQDIPFEQVVELVQPARSMAHTPLFQVMFAWQSASEARPALPGSKTGGVGPASQTTAKFDLSLALGESGGRIVGSLVYATSLFEQATIERHLAYLRRVLEAMAADDLQRVDALPLLPDAERRLVLEEWNATGRAYPTDGVRVHDLFRAQAARTPHAIALSCRGERWTYAELEARSNQIANSLPRRGVGPEVRVGICLPRTLDLVTAMLGVLGAGGAYVPLDPAYPRERLGYMLEDAGVTVVITESRLADRLPEGAATLLIDRERDSIAAESVEAFESGVVPENLSHVIFTSGSTGRPKGVMIRHSSVVVLLHWLRENVTDEERSSVLFSTSINFDVSIAEVFGTLAWGGKLVLVENALELATVEEEIVHVSMVPSAAAELLRGGGIPASVKTLNLGGEALPNALAQGLYALDTVQKVGNLYGPTEDTTYSTYYVVPRGADQVLVGTPVANTQAYVVDARLQPVPVGVTGELYLSGDGLSRGYANHPAMTAERFVPCPFGAPGSRMYRVMDRVRWKQSAEVRECVSAEVKAVRTHALTHSPTAVLEYLGRIDFQVKVRGYRIELGEIEARLAEHPGVRAPVVLVREDAPGDRRLVAYYLGDEPVAVDVLRAHLAERLPEYMVPAAYVWMQAYPLTPNGKVDRRALPAPEGDAYAAGEYAAPVGETEEALAGIWAEVLGVERVGRHDNFFALGGHSLLAVRVISRMRQVLDAEVGIADLFERPVLADLARAIGNAASAGLPPIRRVDRAGRLPLSFAQQRLWFLEQLDDLGDTYHIPMRLRFGGELDRAALRRALDAILARHEALRTTFVEVDGEPVQRIAEESAFHLLEHDLRGYPEPAAELRRLSAEEAGAPFHLDQGPLIRGRLIRLAEDDHLLLLTMHHIVSDGWSMGVLTRELGALYDSFRRGDPDPLPPLPVQYADYAAWQREWVNGEVLREQAEYWTKTLSGAPALLELPTDHPRPLRQDHAGGTVGIDLGEELTARLKALGQRRGTTLFMTLLAGWAAVLGRLSGQDDVVVGTPSANRGRTEIEGLIGFFVNTLALRVDLSGPPTVGELLEQVRERALGAQQNQDIPFEQVVELVRPARSLAHPPLFQVMFAWQSASEAGPELHAPRAGGVAPASQAATAKFDLSLALGEAGGRITGSVTFAAALFERATVERYTRYLRRVLQAMAADESQPVDALPLLPESERRLVVEEWNATDAAYPRELCIHEVFEAQARRTPAAVAVVFDGDELTYAELNARANRLAHHLRTLGVGPDTRVALCLERGVEMVVAMLAVLKAGGAYVPLDPSYPDERLRYMLADSRPAVLLASGPLAARFADAGVPVLDPANDAAWAHLPVTEPRPAGLSPDHLCYAIYTSGSTGLPKGVAVPHRGVASLLADVQRRAPIGEGDGCSLWTSTSFDVSVYEIFSALLAGGRLCIPRDEVRLEAGAFLDWMEAHQVRSAYLPPYFLSELRERVVQSPGRSGLHRLLVGVEPIAEPLLAEIRRSVPGLRIINGYGPTETTICATLHDVPETARGDRVTPIGAPAANTRVFVLDAWMQPVPIGVVGELYVGGVGVARGYLDRPALTAERFVPDPLSGEPGARLYRTGDRGRWLPEGALAFAGRTDAQVKVRGYRVEPGEIEARLLEHPAVREAAVLAREDAPGDRRLVAYVVGDETGAEPLRAHLAERLPEHMVPAAYVRLAAMPLTPSGKVDRKALPAPEGDAFARRGYEPPVGETEQALAEVWSELLRVERVGRHDNFFELGGHSLLAVQVIARMRQVLGVEAPLAHLFSHPTVESLAARVSGPETRVQSDRAIAIRPSGSQPPLFLVYE
ncbi:MAG TPA: amino acid adenylation domain-containing protein, partial [Longimicrobium sp.]